MERRHNNLDPAAPAEGRPADGPRAAGQTGDARPSPGAPGLPAARPDQRFGPEHRLHSNRDYGRAFHRQQKAAGRHVVALVTPRKGRPARVGIMVPAKVVKTAVARHRIKRWVREWFRTARPAGLDGHDLVVLLRGDPGATTDDHRKFTADLHHLAVKALTTTATPGQRGGRRR